MPPAPTPPSTNPPIPPTAPLSAGDLARYLFWVPLRDLLDPASPRSTLALRGAWRLQHAGARRGRALMEDELHRCFGDRYSPEGYAAIVSDAYRAAWRVHLEELLLGKVGPDTVGRFMRFEGLENLDRARARGKGVIWVYPHAGAVMMMMAGLAHQGIPYTQYAARGLPPAEVAKDHPELLATNKLREEVRRVREENEDRLPARFLTLSSSPRELYRRLEANELVGIAYDGRIGTRWAPFDYLGRRALLSPGPYRLAVSTGATIVPAFCFTPHDGPAVCQVGEPIEPGRDWGELALEVLRVEQGWIRRHPEEYGIWLLHARERNHIDDHPLFIDHAIDDRWKRWVE